MVVMGNHDSSIGLRISTARSGFDTI